MSKSNNRTIVRTIPSVQLSLSKLAILRLLKIRGETTLSDLAKITGISKMGVLKHLTKLEQERFIERNPVHVGGLGRPKHAYKLTSRAGELFPKAYTDIALCALAFIEQREGREGVAKMLQIRQSELFERYNKIIESQTSLKDQVSKLSELRDSEGYMARMRSLGKSSFEMLEHNCPILALASKYGEACSTEVELFSMLLGADVDASHRAAAGDSVCRFVIKPRKGGQAR
jgi:predicted ArsR family transcriptional regulator